MYGGPTRDGPATEEIASQVARRNGCMSPHIWFGLAMLAIVVVSLLVTGNLAAKFNERAKADLATALEPLAEQVGGTADVEAAAVEGRYRGQIVSARVISGPGGMGRLFQTTMIEPAGGSAWSAVVRRPRDDSAAWERTFDGMDSMRSDLAARVHERLDALLPFPGWFEIKYEPDAGALRLTRAMQSRRDIPTGERFARYLETLEAVAADNRAVQEAQGAGEGTAAAGSATAD
jgi:hypothetical protein